MATVESPQEMGALIRETRRALGISQRALAARAGCSQRFVSELERGKSTAELGKVLDVLGALSLHVEVSTGRAAVNALVERVEERLLFGTGRTSVHLSDYVEHE